MLWLAARCDLELVSGAWRSIADNAPDSYRALREALLSHGKRAAGFHTTVWRAGNIGASIIKRHCERVRARACWRSAIDGGARSMADTLR